MLSGVISYVTFAKFHWNEAYQPLFLFLLITATVTQLYKVEGPNEILYHATPIFYFAALLLLPFFLFIIIIVVSLSVEWVKERLIESQYLRYWYIQPFNMAMSITAGFTAMYLIVILSYSQPIMATPSFLAIGLAAGVYVFVKETLLGLALALARNVSIRKSGVLALNNLLAELVLILQGYVTAVLWLINPLLILPALTPLIMMYRALRIPQLQQEAQTDAKTGLMNIRYFNMRFVEELDRAQRFGRPLSFIMADLDLLRTINNTYGHLAGDAVLSELGRIINTSIREYDIAARFGGEEFAIMLPETGPEQGWVIAERIRQAVETTEFIISTQDQSIHATMSLGVACFPHDATTATDLQHYADNAVYQAKSQGRNRTVRASDVTHNVRGTQENDDCELISQSMAAYSSLPQAAETDPRQHGEAQNPSEQPRE